MRQKKMELGEEYLPDNEHHKSHMVVASSSSGLLSDKPTGIALSGSIVGDLDAKQFVGAVVCQANKAQKRDYSMARFNAMPPGWKPVPSDALKPYEDLIDKHCVDTNQCVMCSTQVWGSGDPHLGSKRHTMVRAIMAKLDLLMGAPAAGPGARCYGQGYRARKGLFTYEEFEAYWGKQLPHFNRTVRSLTFDKGVMVKSCKSRPMVNVPADKIMAVSVSIVNYAGQGAGKYDCPNKLKWLSVKPFACDPNDQYWPIVVLSFAKDVAEQHQVIFTTDGGDGDGDFDPCQLGELEISEEDARELGQTPQGVWAVCAYQACNSPPTAWPLRLQVQR